MTRRFTIQQLVQLAEQQHMSRSEVASYVDKVRTAVDDLARLVGAETEVVVGESKFDEVEGVLVAMTDKLPNGPVHEFAANRPDQDKGKTLCVGVINHRHGSNFYAGWTVDDVKDQIADFAREWWDQERRGSQLRQGPPPENRDDLIRDYFESVDGTEDWTIDETLIYGGQTTLHVDLVRDGKICDRSVSVRIEETTTADGKLQHRELRLVVEAGGDPRADIFLTVDESRRDLKILSSMESDPAEHTLAVFPERKPEQAVEQE